MKPITNFKWLLALIFIAANSQYLIAQSKADVFNKKVPVTWLGVDYSLTTFIGTPSYTTLAFSPWTVVKKTGEGVITKDEFRDSFLVQWNQLFIDESKKYNVAKAIGRSSVSYAIDVCINANKKLAQKEFFSNDPNDFHKKTEADIVNAVKNYDFQKNDGIGMMYFIEGMNRGTGEEGLWVTFVDIKSKTVLLTKYESSKGQGSGFRNYWAKPLYVALKEMDLNKWK
ncbi:hypothetical protein ACPPVU_24835 [Mucilaginibacter sp. McL0603]|uniref:hypothetical protein n=1 Tax=Mucilaginibacter sp. McL0603 TaxID=3415670 RepID=UPI003CF18DB0